MITLIISLLFVFILDRNELTNEFSIIWPVFFLNIFIVLLVVKVYREYLSSFFTSLREFFVDSIERYDDLVDFQKWLSTILNNRKQLVFSVILGIVSCILSPIYFGKLLGFISIGFAIYLELVSFMAGLALYTFYLFIFSQLG
ncbi:MAG: hypothetical protein HN916_15995 [Anaerolineae bacterium]|nr:hypothetical protein [Anaerolineae bacterium]